MNQREKARTPQPETTLVQAQRQPDLAQHQQHQTTRNARSGCPCGGGCPSCRPLSIQTKLAVGSPNSSAEKEADRLAEQMLDPSFVGKRLARPSAVPTRIETKTTEPEADQVSSSLEQRIRNQLVGGEALSYQSRALFEPRLGRDLGDVRIHQDSAASASAFSLAARAFTVGNHIFFRGGEYQPNSKSGQFLLAHELVHVVQQAGGGSGAVVARSAEAKEAVVDGAAPETVQLKGKGVLEVGKKNEAHFENQIKNKSRNKTKLMLKVQFDTLASGVVEVAAVDSKDGKYFYKIAAKAIELTDPFFTKIATYAPQLKPFLILNANNKTLGGYVGFSATSKDSKKLSDPLKTLPQLFGINGFDLGPLITSENKLEGGKLSIRLTSQDVHLGSVLKGSLDLSLIDGKIDFEGKFKVSVQGLGEGTLNLKRLAEAGLVTGEASIDLILSPSVSGKVLVGWDGSTFNGKGEVGYQGEKFNGKVTFYVMDEVAARKLDAEKRAANPQETGTAEAPPAAAAAPSKKASPPNYVVFGDGMLDFSFTPWLTGNAQVIIDYKGVLTVIGEIRPQSEIPLFDEKAWDKELFKLEASAIYGLPVVGNLFVFANIGMSAFARLGPGKFYQIAVKGNYSTDVTKSNDFSIEGTLNISAAAGLKLRAEGGAGLTILDHDLKAGVGLDGLAGIKGYVEATPVIGYREVGQPSEDKKGEFFLRGDLEIAAQPFLALSGDMFVEVDSPWWSPLPDDKWTWPLGSKEWPVGGSFGIGATTEYVFGSGIAPSLSFHPVEFSGDKFMSDIFSNNTSGKKPAQDKKGTWKEKNSKQAQPPPKPAEEPKKVPDKPKGPSKGSKRRQQAGRPTANAKLIEEMKRKAAIGQIKKAPRPKGTEVEPIAGGNKEERLREANKDKAAMVVRNLLSHGISREDLLVKLKKLQASYKLKSITLDNNNDVIIVNSPPEKVKGEVFGADADAFDAATNNYHGKAREGDKKPDGSAKKIRAVGTLKANAPDKDTLHKVFKPIMPPSVAFPFDVMPPTAPRPESLDVTIEDPVSFSDKARDGGDSKSRTTGLVGKFGLLEEFVIAGGKERSKDKWEGGHLLGHQFGGPDSFDNLVPQRGNTFNRGLYAKVEEFTSKNLKHVKPGSSFMNIHYALTYDAPKSADVKELEKNANLIDVQTNMAKLVAKISGKDLSQNPSIIPGTSQPLSLTFTNFNKIKSNMVALSTKLEADGIKVSKTSTIGKVKDGWNITDHDQKKVFQIKRVDKKMVIVEVDGKAYFGAINATPSETKKTATVTFFPRIPKSYNITFELKGFEEVEGVTISKGKSSKKGGKISEPDYIIKSEGGKEGPAQSHKAVSEALANDQKEDKPKPVSIVVKFNLTAT